VGVLVLLAVVVVLALGESKRWRLWLVWFIVLTEDGAVGCAKMAHTVKLANGAAELRARVAAQHTGLSSRCRG
jgi:hypothetical protein